jgi:hypothetical protein
MKRLKKEEWRKVKSLGKEKPLGNEKAEEGGMEKGEEFQV